MAKKLIVHFAGDAAIIHDATGVLLQPGANEMPSTEVRDAVIEDGTCTPSETDESAAAGAADDAQAAAGEASDAGDADADADDAEDDDAEARTRAPKADRKRSRR